MMPVKGSICYFSEILLKFWSIWQQRGYPGDKFQCSSSFLVPEYVVDWAVWWDCSIVDLILAFSLTSSWVLKASMAILGQLLGGVIPLPSLRRAGKSLQALNWSICTMTEVQSDQLFASFFQRQPLKRPQKMNPMCFGVQMKTRKTSVLCFGFQ